MDIMTLPAARAPTAPAALGALRILLVGPWSETSTFYVLLAAAGAELLSPASLRERGDGDDDIDVVIMDAGLRDSWGRPWVSDLRASAGTAGRLPIVGIHAEPVAASEAQEFELLLSAAMPPLELVRAIAHLFGRQFS